MRRPTTAPTNHPDQPGLPPHQRLLVPAREAAALACIGLSTWHRLVARGAAPQPVRVGGAVRWRRADLERWIAAGCPPCD